MHFSTVVLAAAAGLMSVASAGQVNFYSDTNCQNYIGERHPASFQTTGYAPISPFPLTSPTASHENFTASPTLLP